MVAMRTIGLRVAVLAAVLVGTLLGGDYAFGAKEVPIPVCPEKISFPFMNPRYSHTGKPVSGEGWQVVLPKEHIELSAYQLSQERIFSPGYAPLEPTEVATEVITRGDVKAVFVQDYKNLGKASVSGRPPWLLCLYSAKDGIALTQQLPESIVRCTNRTEGENQLLTCFDGAD
jgi:hypothetical protein